MGNLADRASFYGNHLILEQMKNKAQVLPLASLMTNAINSDSFKTVSIMRTIMEDNKVPVKQDMINLALERKLTDVVETLLPGKYDMEQRKNNYMIKDKENDNITGRSMPPKDKSLKTHFQTRYQKAKNLRLIKLNQRNY